MDPVSLAPKVGIVSSLAGFVQFFGGAALGFVALDSVALDSVALDLVALDLVALDLVALDSVALGFVALGFVALGFVALVVEGIAVAAVVGYCVLVVGFEAGNSVVCIELVVEDIAALAVGRMAVPMVVHTEVLVVVGMALP